jgi:hypothetical protein
MDYGLGDFGDARLKKGGAFLHRRLVEVGQRGVAVRALGGNRAGEMRVTRLLRNPKVRIEEMIECARKQTFNRVGGLHVLAIQDTTSLCDDGSGNSFNLHPTIAIEAETGAVLGLVHAEFLKHEGGKKKTAKKRAIQDKESQRWLTGSEIAGQLSEAGAAKVTVVGDRENDIYEVFALKPDAVELLVRANHDRALELEKNKENKEKNQEEEEKKNERLFAHVAGQAEAGRDHIELAATPGRKKRKAELSIRHAQVEIKCPTDRPKSSNLPESVVLYVVEAREVNPPPGVTPVCWRLLTTHDVNDFAAARWICGLYCQRWTIEELFRTLKTRGFDIERVGIAEEPFEKLSIAALIAALSVLQLVRERDGVSKRPLEDVFHADEQASLEATCQELEGKTAKQKNPHPKGSLAYAAWVCARLGGWTGYYGKPGPIVMLRGLHTFRAIQQGWTMAGYV